jgi:hypothetical protein
MAAKRVAGGSGFGQSGAGEKANPNPWWIFPSFRLAERSVCALKGEKPQISAIFQVWHG